jgi:adenylylsulfate kinase-like enzyme
MYLVSLVSPYKDQRDKFKQKMGNNLVEVHIHTTDVRGREDFFVKEYEAPTEKYLSIDTTNESLQEIREKLVFLWKKFT